jgi:hypothetical protein
MAIITNPREFAEAFPDVIADLSLFDGMRKPGCLQMYDADGALVCAFADGQDRSASASPTLEALHDSLVEPATGPPLADTWVNSKGVVRKRKREDWS